MTKRICLFLPLLLASSIAPAQEIASPDQGGTGVFEFSTMAVFKEFKKQSLPVVSANRRGVFLQTDKGLKRQKYGSKGLTFRPTQARSSVLVRATEIDFELANFAAERRQATVAGALEEGARQAQDYSDRVNTASEARQPALLGPGDSVESVTSDSADARENAENLRAASARFSGTYESADKIFFEYTLVPNNDLENVSAAVVLRHNVLDNHGKPTGRKSTLLSLEKIGDLEAKEPNEVKFALSFTERLLSGLSVQIYLFDGEMNPVASNLASPIRELAASRL